MINGIQLTYYEKGTGDTLILLHGNGSSSLKFQHFFEHFSKKYKVIAIDSRGHGLSETGEFPYNIKLFAEDILLFCRQKEMKNVNIVGYSDGGNIALVLSKLDPQLIHKMIIISPNYKADGVKFWFRTTATIGLLACTPFIKYSESAKFQKWKFDLMIRNLDISKEELGRVLHPTLILAAKKDIIHERHTKEIHDSISNSILTIIEKSNHFNIVTKEKTLQTIERFLD
ncbi:pimeloyl-ACP methyl ester carboxylesterase [Sporosarcina luteola]|nr:pimeloyl-ACP methyl ester carboxylesterase [Sporosarcina luteola]